MAFQARHRWIIGKINEGLGFQDEQFVETSLRDEATMTKINKFFKSQGPDHLLFYYQPHEKEGSWDSNSSTFGGGNNGSNSENKTSDEDISTIDEGSGNSNETRSKNNESLDTNDSSEIKSNESSNNNNNNNNNNNHEAEFDHQDNKLFITDGNAVPLVGQCVYFFRVRIAGKEKRDLDPTVSGDNEISFGTVNASLLGSYETVLSKALQPLIHAKQHWQKASVRESREFCSGLDKFVENVQDNLQSLTAGLELPKPQAHHLELAATSSKISPEVLNHFIELLGTWCEQVENCLDEDEQGRWDSGDKGPDTELEYWRRRTQRLASITEQLKGKECRTVISVLQSLTKSQQQQKLGLGSPLSPGSANQGTNTFTLIGALGGGEFHIQNVISLLRRWRQIDINITEAANEAKDNVKYLATLEKFIDPLYNGTPLTIIDTLPALMNSIKMIHTIARYYNTTERMTGLFMKISNQMIVNCKKHLITIPESESSTRKRIQDPTSPVQSSDSNKTGGRKKQRENDRRFKSKQKMAKNAASNSENKNAAHNIWERDPEQLLYALEACLRLNEAYQEQYHITKDKLLTMPKGRQFDFSETQIFGKMDLFCRRVIKLIDMFSTIHQFKSLGSHHLEGMEGLISQFQRIVAEFQEKEHDLLDFYNNKFDRDYIQFNVRITDLETLLQQFINRSFESITSIEASLTLLKKFQMILQRENLKSDLDSKFTVIFHNYGLDLTTVQELYEKHKHSPPISRNMPPVAGNIMWARHLLRRIEKPMRKFEMNASVLSTKDSKKIIKTYNKVAKTLVAFEYLWYEAWCNSVESARAGLQATLIIRHPQNKKLFVNFDPEILQLIREAKCLARMGIEVPFSAQMVLLQEQKFKHYFNELTYLLREYDRVVGMILPIAKDMLVSHIADLDMTLRPGMVTLTWTSMNIDAYKHSVHTALVRLEELIVNINDIIENRVEMNLKLVGRTILVDLPTDGLLTLDEFVQKQETFVKKQTKFLEAKNVEIETAVNDLVKLVKQYRFADPFTSTTLEQHGVHAVGVQIEPASPPASPVAEQDVMYIREHYNKMMYQGLLQATKNSLAAIKKRVCAKGSTRFLYLVKPFFEVDVQLSVPSVRLVPSLDEVQNCINKSAQSILWCTKSIFDWGQLDVKSVEDPKTGEYNKISFFEKIGKDIQIVRSVLLLTGALLGTKNHVKEYLSGFSGYDWLWKEDMEYMYKRFIDKNPTIEDFENELSRFVAIENKIRQIAGVHNIGALSLNTNNLKLQLQSEASQWKVQYSDKVHQQASEAMEKLFEYMRVTHQRLGREVDSLESLRYVMNVLKEVRERESTIEQEITPILDMYDMLDHYLPAGVVKKEEMDKKSIIRSSWRKLGDFAEEITDQLAGIQGRFKVQLIRDAKAFAHEVATFRNSYIANGPMVVGLKPKEAVERLRRFKSEYEVRARKQETLAAGEELFALKVTAYPELTKTKKELNLLDQLYGLYIDVVDTMEQFRNQLWVECVKKVGAMSEMVAEFEARCKRLPLKLRDWDAYRDLRHDLTDFQNILPLLLELSKPSIKSRHWAQISHLTGIRFNTESGKLKDLWHPTMLNHKEDIEEICHGADKELEIEEKIGSIKEKWAAEHFQFAKWRQRECPVLKGFGQTIEDLEESQLSCQSMLSMRHVAPFREEVVNILGQLSETGEILERWIKVQMLWMSLESVFTGGDIARQMPQDAKKFGKIDKDFHKIMERAQESMGNVVTCCSNDLLKNTLPILFTELEKCQKSLEGYLEQKRSRFPRFYFVSNPVLLQILSQGSDVESVQPYYEKIFDAISQVTHDEDDVTSIVEMKNILGNDREVVPFTNPVKATGNIEDWLLMLEKEMRVTMKDICREAAADCQRTELLEFVDDFTAQFALLGLQLSWTSQVSEALNACRTNKSIMSETNKLQLAILTKLSSLCLTDLGSKMNRRKIETLVTIQVHQRDVFADLFRLFKDRKLSSANDFDWLKQARFYWSSERKDPVVGGQGTCVVSVCDTEFDYSYEYLGCKERLVITPLTDRCYITLTQALGMHLGGAPAGPAGTGKTETVKDLGRTLGIYVVVTNCTDQQRYTDMAKIFKGLCQAGIWGCFDEFNRIELPVLSVVAQQLLAITNAKRMQSTTLTFPGDPDTISLNPSVGTFITMNPGYAGRQELPENLKALFRSVAMMVPDREIIIRVKLCSVGYTKFTELAKKFSTLYRCCEEQLSKQRHYDFGLRNILSVLRTCGQTKRNAQDQDEQLLVMRTLRDMNLSKFVAEDVPLFLSLLDDLFPAVAEKINHQEEEQGAAESVTQDIDKEMLKVIEKNGLQAHPRWVQKVKQVHDTCLVRHGVMIIGPTGSGKSKCLETLTDTLTAVTGVGNKIVRMNPKAIRAEEMFGETDPVSLEWINGVFATLWQKFNDRTRRDNAWIVCDGPVDAIWIENLNTVLDDNKILTLANGDRIPMTDNVKLVFETENLNNASPATVSRAGIIYFSETDLDWQPVLQSWIMKQQETHRPILKDLFQRFFVDCDLFVSFYRLFSPVIRATRVNLIIGVYGLLEELISQVKLSDSPSDVEVELEKLVLFSMIWAIGGLLDQTERKKFDKFLRSLSSKEGLPILGGEANDTCFNYCIDLPSPEWTTWEEPIWDPKYKYTEMFQRDYCNLLVPTSDSIRAMNVLEQMHRRKKPILLVGESGTAKTSCALMFFEKHKVSNPNGRMLFKTVNLSFGTTPHLFQESIEGEIDKRGGKTFGPPGGQQMTVFLDDLSLPEVNAWGDQPTLEIVRQLIETKGMAFLDKDKRGDFKVVEDIQFVAAMNHQTRLSKGPGEDDGNKKEDDPAADKANCGIPNRLLQHFFIFNVVTPDSTCINEIYGRMMQMYFSTAPESISEALKKVIPNAEKLVPATISLWSKVKNILLPTPSKFHYFFTMRDLSRVFQGIMRTPFEVFESNGPKTIIQLWRYEVDRVFSDKLTCSADKQKFQSICDEIVARDLGKELLSQTRYSNGGGNNNGNGSGPNGKKGRDSSASNMSEASKSQASKPVSELITFVDFLRDDEYDEDGVLVNEAPRVYEPAESIEQISQRVEAALKLHNQEKPSKTLDLVLFRDALHHLLRAVRILGLPRGNMLLVGVGGSGKQTVAKLACFICKQSLFQIKLTKTYNLNSLLDDMRGLYRAVGKERRKITFLITEAEIREESFLQVFNSFLTSGEVVGLFPKDELAVMASEMRAFACKDIHGFVDSPENLVKYFIDTIRNNLHVVLCMSPISNLYAQRARRFPGLFTSCVIDWFLPWPREALQAVSQYKFDDFPIECTPQVRSSIVSHMSEVHALASQVSDTYFEESRKRVYQTPKSFLSFLDEFKAMYKVQLVELERKESRIELGLKKLAKGAQDVEEMKVQLAQEEIKLRDAEVACNSMLHSLEQSSMEAKVEAEGVSKIKNECETEAAQITEEKNQAAEELAAAQPFLDEAENAVNSIKPNDLNELKKLPKPGDIIKLTFDGVMILRMFRMNPVTVNQVSLGIGKEKKKFDFIQDSYSLCQKTMLSDSGFLKALFRFSEQDKDNINEETIELLMPYLELDGFSPSVARNASKACEGLCSWVIAMVKYHAASKVVKPKLEKLGLAEAKLEAAMQQLDSAEKNLQKCKDKLEALQEKFQVQMSAKQKIEAGTLASKRKMEQATALIDGLIDERTRWTEDGKVFADTKKRLVGDCAIASAFLSYCGPFNQEFRNIFINEILFDDLKKRSIPVTTKNMGESDNNSNAELFDLTQFLCDPVTIGEWSLQSLPSDHLSVENGILVTRCSRYPLLIDPQGQGLEWIKNKEAGRMPHFGTTTLDHPSFRDQLEFAMAEGLSLIVLDIENDLDPLLDPVLEKQIVTRAKAKYVMMGGKPCDFSDDFRLFLITCLQRPTFGPELQAKTTVIDFAVTGKGLEAQLLGQVIRKEQRALEDQLSDVLESVTLNTKRLHELNQDLLQRLTENSGNLLDDTELISVLASTKKAATEVKEKLKVADETKLSINEKREQYRAVAARGSVLYFSIVDMANVNSMYQTSLEQFMRIFLQSMEDAEKSNSVIRRVGAIISHLTYQVYRFVNRGLYKRDKLTFVFVLLLRILDDAGHLNSDIMRLLLRGGAALNLSSLPPKKVSWLPESAYRNLYALSKRVDFFKSVLDNIVEKEPIWQKWFDDNEPEQLSVPDYEAKFSTDAGALYRLLLIRSIREDRTVVAVKDFIQASDQIEAYGSMQPCLGPAYVAPVTDTIESVYEDMSAQVPVIFLLASGDPTESIEAVCRKHKHPITCVSMGEGQSKVALKILSAAISNGDAVLIQNGHLDTKFMTQLNEILNSIKASIESSQKDGENDQDQQETQGVESNNQKSEEFSSRNTTSGSSAQISRTKPKQHQQHLQCNPRFRLFITTEHSDEFPINLLQRSIKVTSEAPGGIKANLQSIYSELIDQEVLDRLENDVWRKLLFGLSFMHSVVLERRRFGSLGFVVPYEFAIGDLVACHTWLEKHLFNSIQGEVNYSAAQYIFGEVQYGGRVTDDHDRKIINAYVERWITPTQLIQGHPLNPSSDDPESSQQEDYVYSILDHSEVEFYLMSINSMPDVESPSILGLHGNADLSFRLDASKSLLEKSSGALLSTSAGSRGSSAAASEEIISNRCQDLLSKLKEPVPHPIRQGAGPLEVVRRNEYLWLRNVIRSTCATLKQLILSLKGEALLTEELAECMQAIENGSVPKTWLDTTFYADSLAVWSASLLKRVSQVSSWSSSSGSPSSYWLPGISYVSAFISAMSQTVVRQHQDWSLDNVAISSRVTEMSDPNQVRSAPTEGVYVHGLYLQGASFDITEQALIESPPKVLDAPVPVVLISVAAVQRGDSGGGPFAYDAPVDTYRNRNDYLFSLLMPSKHRSNHWLLRGVAIILNTK